MFEYVKVAFGSVPKDGGTFTFYRLLRPVLLEQGIDLRCVTVGQQEAGLWNSAFADEGCVLLAEKTTNRKKQAQVFVSWCEENQVDVVFGVNSVAILSALPHLPQRIRVMARCANAFDHGYRITIACYARLVRIVALAPRQIDDLVRDYGVAEERCMLIPNGADRQRFEVARKRVRGQNPVLQLGFMGRLEHKQKGVLFLPEILQQLTAKGITFNLKIAGQGVHEGQLRKELVEYLESGVVEFVGLIEPEAVPEFLQDIDIYLFPSLFEGSPNALLEAMMAGCVPAAWNLKGLIDFLLADGSAGLLAEVGDCKGLAEQIVQMAKDRPALQALSKRVAERASKHYSRERVLQDYIHLFDEIMTESAPEWQPRSWSQFKVDPAFAVSGWRGLVPEVVRAKLKKVILGY